MKKHIIAIICALAFTGLDAQETASTGIENTDNSKKEIVKKGFNFGPLPVVAFDADKGFL